MPVRHFRLASKLPLLNSLADSTNPINIEVLPIGLALRFDPVRQSYYERTSIMLPNPYSDEFWHNDYTIRIDLVEALRDRFDQKKLFVSLDPHNSGKFWDSLVKRGVSKIKYREDIYYYRIEDDAVLDWLFYNWYAQGFYEGYSESYEDCIDPESYLPVKESIYAIASDILSNENTQYDLMSTIENDFFDSQNVISPHLFCQLGSREGRFVKVWDIVLNHPNLFSDILSENSTFIDVIQGLQLNVGKVDAIEHLKSLMESDFFHHSHSQKEILSKHAKFYNINLSRFYTTLDETPGKPNRINYPYILADSFKRWKENEIKKKG